MSYQLDPLQSYSNLKPQPSFGNGGKGHGRRIEDEKQSFAKAKDNYGKVGKSAKSGETLGEMGGRILADGFRSWPKSRTSAAVGTGTVVGGAGYGLGRRHGRRSEKLRRAEKAEAVGKSRFYDPEHRRQRRLGMAQAGLAGAGVAGLAVGGRGALKTTKAVRALPTRVPKGGEGGAKAGTYIAHGQTKSGKGVLALRRRDAAALAGGVAGTGGAIGLRSYAESRRGGGWR